MLTTMTRYPARSFALMFVLAAALSAPQSASADEKDLTRPNCKECGENRAKLDGAKARIEKSKKRQREEILDANTFRDLDKRIANDKKISDKAFIDLQRNCKNGCPASVPVKVKPVKADGTCDACKKISQQLADVRTQIKQLRAEQDFIGNMKRTVSVRGSNAMKKQLAKLKAQERSLNEKFVACERNNCRKEKDDKQEASAIGKAAKDIKKKLEDDKKNRRKKSGSN